MPHLPHVHQDARPQTELADLQHGGKSQDDPEAAPCAEEGLEGGGLPLHLQPVPQQGPDVHPRGGDQEDLLHPAHLHGQEAAEGLEPQFHEEHVQQRGEDGGDEGLDREDEDLDAEGAEEVEGADAAVCE